MRIIGKKVFYFYIWLKRHGFVRYLYFGILGLLVGGVVLCQSIIWRIGGGILFIVIFFGPMRIKKWFNPQCKREAPRLNHRILWIKFKEIYRLIRKRNYSLLTKRRNSSQQKKCFIVLGAKGSGKTSFIKAHQSELTTLHDDFIPTNLIQTKDCNCYSAKEYIFIEIASEYIDEFDHDNRARALSLFVKKLYRKKLLQGIIFIFDFNQIIMSNDQEKQWQAYIIGKVISSLSKIIGKLDGISFVLNKVDRIYGFNSFYHHSSISELEQLQGFSCGCDVAHCPIDEYFSDFIIHYYLSLSKQSLKKITYPEDILSKAMIYEFPQQTLLAFQQVQLFIKLVNQTIYPIDCLNYFSFCLTSLNQDDSRDALYFYKENDKIFHRIKHENNSIGESRRYFVEHFINHYVRLLGNEHHHLIKKRFMLAFSGVALISTFFIYHQTYIHDMSLLNQAEEIIQQLDSKILMKSGVVNTKFNDLLEASRFYDSLRAKHVYGYINLSRLWKSKLAYSLGEVIALIVHVRISNHLIPLLEKRLRYFNVAWVAMSLKTRGNKVTSYYLALRSYMMLHYLERIDIKNDAIFLSQEVMNMMHSNTGQFHLSSFASQDQQTLTNLFAIYLLYLSKSKGNNTIIKKNHINNLLVMRCRKQLQTTDISSILYYLFEIEMNCQLKQLSLDDLLPQKNNHLYISGRHLPEMYTLKFWNAQVHAELKKTMRKGLYRDWVIYADIDSLHASVVRFSHVLNINFLDGRSANQLSDHMYELYVRHYQQQWIKFLSSMHLEHFHNYQQADHVLSMLAVPNGPIVQLFQLVLKNVPLCKHIPLTKKHSCQFALKDIQHSIFQGKVLSIEMIQYLKSLSKLRQELRVIFYDLDPTHRAKNYVDGILGNHSEQLALKRSVGALKVLLMGASDRETNHGFNNLLIAPIRETWRVIIHQATGDVQRKWREQISDFIDRKIEFRYPFVKTKNEVNIADINELLRPKEGLLWQFVNEHLSSFIELRQRQWVEKKWLGIGVGFSQEYLNFLTHAQQMTDGFYSDRSKAPSLKFQLYPIPSPRLSAILLHIDGQNYRYDNGPQRWVMLHWFGEGSDQEVRMSGLSSNGKVLADVSYDGPWALFHLIDSAQHYKIADGATKLTWVFKMNHAHQVKIHFLLKNEMVTSLFQRLLWRHFDFPARLFNSVDWLD